VLIPIRYALSAIEKIEFLGPERVPKVILEKWNVVILRALEFGGIEFEL